MYNFTMAYGYMRRDREQLFLLPPSMLDWLEEGHLAYFLIDAVGLLDTSAFDEVHPTEGAGRPAYDPVMMLTMTLYAYATGMRSSRAIEAACRQDVAFRVICVNLVPHFTTIARFRAEHEEAIKALFIEVVKLCHRAGLASLGQIAIDGTKIGSDAALDRNRDGAWIQAEIDKILAEATGTDEAEDATTKPFDNLVEEPLRQRRDRLGRLQAALSEVEAEEARVEAEEAARARRAEEEAAAGRKLGGRKPKDPHAALARARADLAATKVKAARAPGSEHLATAVARATEALDAAERVAAEAPRTKIVANVTDPESRIMNTKDGWVQGYNVQVSANANQVVIAYAATQDHNDVDQLLPMIKETQRVADRAGIDEPIGLATADAGYWSEENATAEGPDRLIATTKDWKQRKAAREMGETTGPPPEGASPLEQMEHRLRTEEGAASYATRSYTVEPVFGDMKENRGFRRFMRRGLAAADSEAGLIFAAHNLLKVFHHNPGVVFSAT